ncbi:Putative replication factor A protein [Septoria linicola]|uniref:CST complex subunit STN1 n=1 Tax=Septoria linicola TaxID=215465 RepID=A0A9Q9AU35_9PEZI|nr:Putative replication factor A protein [Septoria linicola]
MTTAASGSYPLYPARYFDASPTWFRWNKLTATDVFALREEPDFEGQHVWFWLNHPIRFVRLVGYVCQVDMVAGGKYVLLTMDDGSGANVEVKIERPVAYREHSGAVYSTNTTLDNVQVMSEMSLPVVHIGNVRVDIGTVLNAEGKVESYRMSRQLIAERLRLVNDTNEEAVHWSKTAHWKRNVLNKPWFLSDSAKQAADAKLREDATMADKHEKETRHRKRRSAKVEERRRVHEAEIERKREERTEYYNRGALPGTNVIKMPWDN